MTTNSPAARYQFTSESVSEGHPDKVADRISDAILDACLAVDSRARVAAETLVTAGRCILACEVSVDGAVDFASVARDAIRDIGYAGGVNVELSRHSHMAPEVVRESYAFLRCRLAEDAGSQGLGFSTTFVLMATSFGMVEVSAQSPPSKLQFLPQPPRPPNFIANSAPGPKAASSHAPTGP